jgi:hypothetical protein
MMILVSHLLRWGGELMKNKIVSGIVLLLVVVMSLNVCSVMGKPQKAEDKNDNPNLHYVTVGSGIWLILENGSGPKRGWCISGSSVGQSVVYRDASKLGAKAEEKLLASGKWVPSGIFEGYIYKIVQYVDV